MRSAILTAAAVALAVEGIADATASASGQIFFYAGVSAPVGDPSTPNVPVVRPAVLYLTYDGAVVATSLRWSSWGGSVAQATGVYSASDCNPSCATGQRTNNPARVTLSSPGSILGHEVYRCFQLTVPAQAMDQLSCLRREGTFYIYRLVSKPKGVGFYTPSRNIVCSMFDNGSSNAYVLCDIYRPNAMAQVLANGRVTIHRGQAGNFGVDERSFRLLSYGSSATAGRFRCRSASAGVTCVVTKTGKGFFLSKQSIRAVG
jgi:hypothetical protein